MPIKLLPAANTPPDAVIVGAGPMGLKRAIKLASAGKKVLVLERHAEYSRSQYLSLNMAQVDDPDIEAALRQAIRENKADLHENSILIGIQDLERCLLEIAKQKGVEIKIAQVESAESVYASYPNCKLFFAGDGAHSIMRRSLFGEENKAIEKTALRHLVQLTYKVNGKAEKLSRLKNLNAQASLITNGGIVCNEQVKYDPEKNESTVLLGFIVFESVYKDKRLKNATAKKPMPLTKNIPPNLFHAINRWLYERGDKNFIDGTQKLNKTELHFFRAKESSHYNPETGVTTFLIGDALIGLPYQNGLNAGWAISNKLDKLLATKPANEILAEYEQAAQQEFKERISKIKKIDRDLTIKKIGVWSYYTQSWVPMNIAAAWRDEDHPMFHTKNEAHFRWLWIAAGTIIFAGVAAAFSLSFGALPALAIAAIIIGAAIIGFITGYRLWKITRSHKEGNVVEVPPPPANESRSPRVAPHQRPTITQLPRSASSYSLKDYQGLTLTGQRAQPQPTTFMESDKTKDVIRRYNLL